LCAGKGLLLIDSIGRIFNHFKYRPSLKINVCFALIWQNQKTMSLSSLSLSNISLETKLRNEKTVWSRQENRKQKAFFAETDETIKF